MTTMRNLAAGVLGVILLGAAPPIDWSKADVVTVIELDYRFEPTAPTIRVGVPTRLHVENHGAETHEIDASNFFKAVQLKNPETLNPERTELLLHPGEQQDVYFVATLPGRYPFSCADHDWAGMSGVFVVQ